MTIYKNEGCITRHGGQERLRVPAISWYKNIRASGKHTEQHHVYNTEKNYTQIHRISTLQHNRQTSQRPARQSPNKGRALNIGVPGFPLIHTRRLRHDG